MDPLDSNYEWYFPPATLDLNHDEVHLWRANLELSPPDLERLDATLSADERARAAQFRFAKDRQHFVAARGVLRDILGRYLGRSPAPLAFRYSSSGKPALASGCGDDQLSFNLSHSRGLALYAITRHRRVGVDVERIEPRLADIHVAERIFSRQEMFELRALPVRARPKAFFNGWTRKEAYLKARGEGLLAPLDSFDVTLGPSKPAALLNRPNSKWSLQGLTLPPDYVAAIAVEGDDWHLRLWQWAVTSPADLFDRWPGRSLSWPRHF